MEILCQGMFIQVWLLVDGHELSTSNSSVIQVRADACMDNNYLSIAFISRSLWIAAGGSFVTNTLVKEESGIRLSLTGSKVCSSFWCNFCCRLGGLEPWIESSRGWVIFEIMSLLRLTAGSRMNMDSTSNTFLQTFHFHGQNSTGFGKSLIAEANLDSSTEIWQFRY